MKGIIFKSKDGIHEIETNWDFAEHVLNREKLWSEMYRSNISYVCDYYTIQEQLNERKFTVYRNKRPLACSFFFALERFCGAMYLIINNKVENISFRINLSKLITDYKPFEFEFE